MGKFLEETLFITRFQITFYVIATSLYIPLCKVPVSPFAQHSEF